MIPHPPVLQAGPGAGPWKAEAGCPRCLPGGIHPDDIPQQFPSVPEEDPGAHYCCGSCLWLWLPHLPLPGAGTQESRQGAGSLCTPGKKFAPGACVEAPGCFLQEFPSGKESGHEELHFIPVPEEQGEKNEAHYDDHITLPVWFPFFHGARS